MTNPRPTHTRRFLSMVGSRPTQKLRLLIPALAIVTALTAYAAVVEKHAGPAETRVAKAAQAVLGQSATPAAPAPAAPSGHPPADVVSAAPRPAPSDAPPSAPAPRVRSIPPAPPAGGGEIGRPNPFAAPGFARPPARPGPPSFGLDLPLPPGTGPAAAVPPPPPPPGAGMSVGAIVGSGSERVAIIQEGGQPHVVGVGDRVGEAVVVEIRDDKVIMRQGTVTFELPYAGGGSVGLGNRVGEAPVVQIHSDNVVQIPSDTVVMYEAPHSEGAP